MHRQQPHENNTQHRPRKRQPQPRAKPRRIKRRLRGNKHIARHEVRAIAQAQDDGSTNGRAGASTQIIRHPGDGHAHLEKRAAAHGEQREVADRRREAAVGAVDELDDPADGDERDAEKDEGEAPADTAGEVAAEDLENETGEPDGDGHYLRFCGLPA